MSNGTVKNQVIDKQMSPATGGSSNRSVQPGAAASASASTAADNASTTMARGADTGAKIDCSAATEVLENVRRLLGDYDAGPVSRTQWDYRVAALALVVWPEGLDRRHLAHMALTPRTAKCLHRAKLLSGTGAITTRDLLLPNFGPKSFKELFVGIERFLKAVTDDPAGYLPAGMNSELLNLARRCATGEIAPGDVAKSGSDLRSAVAILKVRLDAVVAAMSPVQRTVFDCRRLEDPQPTFAGIGKRCGVTRARIQYLHSIAQGRVRRAAGSEASFAAAVLKSRLGHVVTDNAMRKHLDEALGRDDGLAGHLLRQELLHRMGYVLKRGVYLDDEARELIGTLRAFARDHADDAGLVDESELLALLAGPEWCSHWQFLLGHAGLHRVHGRIAVRRIGKAAVKAALLSIGKPATRDEIAGVCGLTGIQTSAALWSLPSVVRATKDRWALNDWVAVTYKGIPKEIMRRIREDGGATAIERVLTEIPARFGVRAESVRTYLQTPRFLVRDGLVRLADERTVKLKSIDEAAHGRDPDGAPYWTFRVHQRHLQGFSVVGFPPEFAKELGCEPQHGMLVRIDNLPACRDLSVHWRLASNSGASVGRIADALRALGIQPGEYARIALKGPGLVELTAADGTVTPGSSACAS